MKFSLPSLLTLTLPLLSLATVTSNPKACSSDDGGTGSLRGLITAGADLFPEKVSLVGGN